MSDITNSNGPDTPDTNGEAPATASPSADAGATTEPAETPAELTVVQISRADLDALIAAAAAKSANSTPAVKPPVPRVTSSTALKVGEPVLHNGRLAQVIAVLTTNRDINGETWEQYLYHVGVFAEEHIVDAEDVGKAS